MIRMSNKETELKNFQDDASELDPVTLQLVQAAMKAGETSFTTPTPDNDQGRVDWRVKRVWAMVAETPTCFLVACQALNEHFEVVGPKADLKNVTIHT